MRSKPFQLVVALLFAALGAASAGAQGNTALLLTGEAGLEGSAKERLGALEFVAAGPRADYAARVFTTEEGTKLPFADLFRPGAPEAGALRALHDQYGARYAALVWVEDEKTEEASAYGLSRRTARVRVRVVETATARAAVDEVVESMGSFGTAGAAKRGELLKSALARLDGAKVKQAFSEGAAPPPRRVAVVFEGIGPTDYFEHRGDFLTLAREAGVVEPLRDGYDEGEKALTVRGGLKGELDETYRALYLSARRSPAFDSFEVKRGQAPSTLVVVRLPPLRRALVVTGVSADRCHERLALYRKVLAGLEGVKDVDGRFEPGDTAEGGELRLDFTYGGKLPALEESLWAALKGLADAPNRRLVSVSAAAIVYGSRATAGEEAPVVVAVTNLSPASHRLIGAALDALVKGLGGTDFTKEYDPDLYRLTYRFLTPSVPAAVDEALWAGIHASPLLVNLAQDATSGSTVGFVYLDRVPGRRTARVVVKNLSPEDYQNQGLKFAALVEALPGVSGLKREYAEATRTLTATFEFAGASLQAVDQALWAEVKRDPGLAKLAMGGLAEDELTYFFGGGDGRVGELAVLLRRTPGQAYNAVAVELASLLGGLPGVRDVRHSYDYRAQTAVFHFVYEGASQFSLEDALTRKLAASTLLRHVARGSSFPRRLEYHYFDRPVTLDAPPDGGDDPGAGRAGAPRRLRVKVNRLAPEQYRSQGLKLVKALEALPSVSGLTRDYAEGARVLTLDFDFTGDALQRVDDAVWAAVKRDPDLAGLVPGDSTENVLEYSFGEKRLPPGEREPRKAGGRSLLWEKGDLAELVARLDPSAVTVLVKTKGGGGHGSGSFVTADGYILTNRHVAFAEGVVSLQVRTFDGQVYPAQRIRADTRYDLALVKVTQEGRPFPPVELGDSQSVRKGQSVLVIGTPLQEGYANSVSQGIVSGLDREGDGGATMQITAPTYGGNSGSPVFTTQGRVIGVLTAGALDSVVTPSNQGWARDGETKVGVGSIGLVVPLDDARELLDSVGVRVPQDRGAGGKP